MNRWIPYVALLIGPGIIMTSGCSLTHKMQERDLYGSYRCTTDFSRDLLSMNGDKRTVVYPGGRQETLRFLPDHRFISHVHFSTDRVPDERVKGSWRMIGYDKVEVHIRPERHHRAGQTGHTGRTGSYAYYALTPNQLRLIRLDQNGKQLAREYAPFYTFYRLEDQVMANNSK